ncbi:3-beta-hydroxysteroid-Delta(8),Delta(7)-isomerase [Cladobotryum mycophilum]|uniref:3-beta-hydroxysteroid-Delta(8), Delta(7)-isomerase n=1 Tax=Cladobotryum mycophilum TaxID=491253 RepID=A0ABR0SB87_9HYPO
MAQPTHPYYPLSVPLPHYAPNDQPLARVLPLFAGLTGAVVLSAYYLAARSRHRLRFIDRFAAAWFALSGFLHVFFEGYYILHHDRIAGMNTFFAQLWKEYTLSDSRYLTSDLFTVCIETITVFAWGPLSLLAFLTIISNASSRHLFQVVICMAHLYGVTLYYATNWAESRFHGTYYSRPEFMYFWVYYVGFNAPWAVVPLVLLRDSYHQIVKAFKALEEKESQLKRE